MNDEFAINPFRDNIVQDAWQTPSDVPEIHDEVFKACLVGIESAARGVPDSLLIFGPAGSGKTHLLTRLQRHLAATSNAAPDRVLHCVFVFVRLQTSAALLWQHIRKRLAYDLMRRDQGVTQLQRLIAHQMALGNGASPRAKVMGLRVLSSADHDTLINYLTTVADSLGLPRDLCVVLEHLACGRHVRDAFAWLAGESLPDFVLSQLGVGPDVVEDREASARDLVTALCRLAGETLPIVFCFDQVEALQQSLEDRDAFYRFGRTAADLCDADPNVFIITCLQSSYLELLKSCIRGADRDRMAKREAILQSLTRLQVEKLIASRSSLLGESNHVLGTAQPSLPGDFVTKLAQEGPVVARQVLSSAARAFDELKNGSVLSRQDMGSLLRRDFTERCYVATRDSVPADTESILLQGLQAISLVQGVHGVIPEPKTADFLLEGTSPVAVEICNEANGRSLGPRLKRILSNTPRKDGARTVILRDPRLPIAKSATKTRAYLLALRERGVMVVEPTVEALSALAALGALLADAKAGDLTNDGATIPESSVVNWIRSLASDLQMEPVRELVDALLGTQSVPIDSAADDLAELLARKRILEVEVASAHLDIPTHRIAEIARCSTERFLLLEGPPVVVMDVAGIVADSEGIK